MGSEKGKLIHLKGGEFHSFMDELKEAYDKDEITDFVCICLRRGMMKDQEQLVIFGLDKTLV